MTTAVVGGGLAGALTARALHLSGEEVVVLDASPRPGGIAAAHAVDGYLLEPAAGTVTLPHPALTPLLAGLDVAPVRSTATRRWIRHRGRTFELRPGPALLASPLVSPGGKLRALAELFVGRGGGGESLEGFMTRRLGSEVGRLAAWLMSAGVHAGDPASLPVSTFPALEALERRHGSLLRGGLATRRNLPRPSSHVIPGGTAMIAEAVSTSLGDGWRGRWPVERIETKGSRFLIHGPETLETDRVVATVPPHLLGSLLTEVGEVTQAASWAPVAVVWLGLVGLDLPEGFGALLGPDDSHGVLGLLYESSYAPFRAPAGKALLKAIVGGARFPEFSARPDRILVGAVVQRLTEVLGVEPTVEFTHVVRHDPGIPQHTGAHRRMVVQLRGHLPPDLQLAGWAYDGVGVGDLATAARRIADAWRGGTAARPRG